MTSSLWSSLRKRALRRRKVNTCGIISSWGSSSSLLFSSPSLLSGSSYLLFGNPFLIYKLFIDDRVDLHVNETFNIQGASKKTFFSECWPWQILLLTVRNPFWTFANTSKIPSPSLASSNVWVHMMNLSHIVLLFFKLDVVLLSLCHFLICNPTRW